MNIEQDINWEKVDGLLPAVIQSAKDGTVLMLGYMNKEALSKTLDTGKVVFFSRTKQRLWKKGETFGNELEVVGTFLDCDGDTLLIRANPKGPTCHRNTTSCFSEDDTSTTFIPYLEGIIQDRFKNGDDNSYVRSLHNKGTSKIVQKVGEEAVEVVIATLEGDQVQIREEAADLVFHLLVNLQHMGIPFSDILEVLKNRHK